MRGPAGTRTRDLVPARHARYQLRHKPIRRELGNRTPRFLAPNEARSPRRSFPMPRPAAPTRDTAGRGSSCHPLWSSQHTSPPAEAGALRMGGRTRTHYLRFWRPPCNLLHLAHMKLLPYNEKPPGPCAGRAAPVELGCATCATCPRSRAACLHPSRTRWRWTRRAARSTTAAISRSSLGFASGSRLAPRFGVVSCNYDGTGSPSVGATDFRSASASGFDARSPSVLLDSAADA